MKSPFLVVSVFFTIFLSFSGAADSGDIQSELQTPADIARLPKANNEIQDDLFRFLMLQFDYTYKGVSPFLQDLQLSSAQYQERFPGVYWRTRRNRICQEIGVISTEAILSPPYRMNDIDQFKVKVRTESLNLTRETNRLNEVAFRTRVASDMTNEEILGEKIPGCLKEFSTRVNELKLFCPDDSTTLPTRLASFLKEAQNLHGTKENCMLLLLQGDRPNLAKIRAAKNLKKSRKRK